MSKLSSEARNKLREDQFCGPDRSFPVNDCDHVIAAKRMIDRYKGEGDKNSIMACVRRKEKTLSCKK